MQKCKTYLYSCSSLPFHHTAASAAAFSIKSHCNICMYNCESFFKPCLLAVENGVSVSRTTTSPLSEGGEGGWCSGSLLSQPGYLPPSPCADNQSQTIKEQQSGREIPQVGSYPSVVCVIYTIYCYLIVEAHCMYVCVLTTRWEGAWVQGGQEARSRSEVVAYAGEVRKQGQEASLSLITYAGEVATG